MTKANNRLLLASACGGLKHMSAERTREVVDALLAKTVAGPVELPGGLVAGRNRRAIRIGRHELGTTHRRETA
jgi:hypothetical protein